ncbi:MAG: SUMF1/EgtB/PvdO family nonheme iron enzyme [Henriciella sp.]
MADIFLSYSRADRPIAQTMAEALEAEGFSVWWDKILRAGQTYDEVTETMLRDAQVVIVLWSETSVQSKWVRAEATLGQRKCELVPVMIEDAERPIMFELVQTADLIGWSGDREDQRWKEFAADVQRSLEKARAGAAEAPVDPKPVAAPPPKSKPKKAPKPAAAAPAPSAAQPTAPAPATKQKKKPSGLVPILLGGLVVVGGGAWFGLQAMQDGEAGTTKPSPPEPEILACAECPDMISVPGGSAVLGSAEDERGRSGNEGPVMEVTVASFWMSQAEITRAEWQVCVNDGGCRPAQGGGEDGHPVTGISWSDASAYADWLSTKANASFRLPSEAEWEYAARAGTQTLFWWGNDYPGAGVVQGETRAVSALPENPFGLSGMLGNVREWVADCYINNHADAPTNGQAVTTGDCSRRVVKGGSFRLDAAEHRPANRARYRATVRDRSLGFRVVADKAGT